MKYLRLILAIIGILILTLFIFRDTSEAETLNHYQPETVMESIMKWSIIYGVDTSAMIRVGMCESRLNPKALNPKDSDGLPAKGLFQYKERTFNHYSKEVGIKDADIWDFDHQSQTTAYMWSIGEKRQWGCK